MSNLEIVHTSPEQLIVITPTVDGVPVTTGYTVCILPIGITPDKTNAKWQAPDVAGSASGVFVGPDTVNPFNAGDVAMPWCYLIDNPEKLIFPCPPAGGGAYIFI